MKERMGVAKSKNLQPLKVNIYRKGRIVRTVTIPDPRTYLIAQLNDQGKEFGLTAKVA